MRVERSIPAMVAILSMAGFFVSTGYALCILAWVIAHASLRFLEWLGTGFLYARSVRIGQHTYFIAPYIDGPDALVRLDWED